MAYLVAWTLMTDWDRIRYIVFRPPPHHHIFPLGAKISRSRSRSNPLLAQGITQSKQPVTHWDKDDQYSALSLSPGWVLLARILLSSFVRGTLAWVTSRLWPALHPLDPLAPLSLSVATLLPSGFRRCPFRLLLFVHTSEGAGSPANQFPTASRRNVYTDFPCLAHVVITVQIRSLHCLPFSLRVPCV